DGIALPARPFSTPPRALKENPRNATDTPRLPPLPTSLAHRVRWSDRTESAALRSDAVPTGDSRASTDNGAPNGHIGHPITGATGATTPSATALSESATQEVFPPSRRSYPSWTADKPRSTRAKLTPDGHDRG